MDFERNGDVTAGAEGHEVRLPGLLEALESPRHGFNLCSSNCPTQAKKRLERAPARFLYIEKKIGRPQNLSLPVSLSDGSLSEGHFCDTICAFFVGGGAMRVTK